MNGHERLFGIIGGIAIAGLLPFAAPPGAPRLDEAHQKVVAGANNDLSPLSVPLERDASAGAPRRDVGVAKEVRADEERLTGAVKGRGAAGGSRNEMLGTQSAALSTMRTGSDAQSLMTLSGKPSKVRPAPEQIAHPSDARDGQANTSGAREGWLGELKGDNPRWNPRVGSHRTERLGGDGHGETVVHLWQATYVQRILGAVPISAPRYSARTTQETATARTVCLLVTFDLCQSATKCAGPIIGDTSVEFSHALTGSSTPLTKSVRIDRNNHAEWTAIVPFEATGSTSGYQFAATGKPSERSVTFLVYCPPKTAKAAAAMKAAAGRPTLAVSSQASLRDAALKNAQEELWERIQINPTRMLATHAPANVVARSASIASTVSASTASSVSTVDCRASIAAPDPSLLPDPNDDSNVAKKTRALFAAWTTSIAEADANCATAERWRAAINASPRPQWVKDAYDGALRNHGDVVRGWLATVQQTGDPSYSPLRWMCEHGLDSPLWWTVQQVTSDRPANIKYTQVRISTVAHGYPISDFTITLNDPRRQVTAYGLPEFDPACTRCTFSYWTPCMADTITSVGWEQVAPGRIDPVRP